MQSENKSETSENSDQRAALLCHSLPPVLSPPAAQALSLPPPPDFPMPSPTPCRTPFNSRLWPKGLWGGHNSLPPIFPARSHPLREPVLLCMLVLTLLLCPCQGGAHQGPVCHLRPGEDKGLGLDPCSAHLILQSQSRYLIPLSTHSLTCNMSLMLSTSQA